MHIGTNMLTKYMYYEGWKMPKVSPSMLQLHRGNNGICMHMIMLNCTWLTLTRYASCCLPYASHKMPNIYHARPWCTRIQIDFGGICDILYYYFV